MKHPQPLLPYSFGSLFAGVGGFDLGFEAAGYDCKFQVEWDNHCQQTLAYHWPDVPRWGDVSEVSGYDLPPVDVITYGFPCQDLSVAGKRAGLDGNRSGLFFEAVRIIKEMREATNGLYPTFAVAENVVGLLNADGGSAMARCLDTLAEAGALAQEWCVLDAQFFGVPQRRRRVFLAACFDSATAGRCPDQIFPVAKSGARHPAESNQTWKNTATGTGSSTTQSFRMLGFGHYEQDENASTIQARDHKYATDLVAFVAAAQPIGFSHTQGLDAQPSTVAFPTLRKEGAGHAVVAPGLAVRRLTPLECERLMGWPDNHTLNRADGKQNLDGARYKMCGNGVAAPVARWVAEQISFAMT
jgi:DNA (cytosine-5)-methyltransferase 1